MEPDSLPFEPAIPTSSTSIDVLDGQTEVVLGQSAVGESAPLPDAHSTLADEVAHQPLEAVNSEWFPRAAVPTVSPLMAVAGGPPAVEIVSVAPCIEYPAHHQQLCAQHFTAVANQGCTRPALSPVAEQVPAHLEVVCGTLRGTFITATSRVLVKENGCLTREISPNEMERLGGRAQTKKWKQSIKLVNPDGTTGRSIGEWIRDQGLGSRTHTHAPSICPIIRDQTALHPVNSQDAHLLGNFNLAAAKEAMDAHLSRLNLGFRPGDPSARNLPNHLPKPNPVGGQGVMGRMVDLRQMSYQQLLVLARANGRSGGEVLSTLLPLPPGVQPGRQAFTSGQEGPKRLGGHKHSTEGLALLGDYLAGGRVEPPWEALGADKPPTIADQEVDLRQLYALVKEAGGCEEVSVKRGWQCIAEKIGLEDGMGAATGSSLRSFYQRFLLRAEMQEEALNQYQPDFVKSQMLASDGSGALEHGTSLDADEENGKGGIGENQILEIGMKDDGKANGDITQVDKMVLQCA